jgi:glycosidase
MSRIEDILNSPVPRSLKEASAHWPERETCEKSPHDWRDEVFYFLLPDRFSNGKETPERLLKADLSTPSGVAEIKTKRSSRWDEWQRSGAERFQGGTLAGVRSKLPYLADLGVTTLWLGPVFRQRVEENTYHGYGIHDFLDVDPRFGTRRDLVDLVDAAHRSSPKMRVVLDVIFNHSGCNWLYDAAAGDVFQPSYRPSGGYAPIWPRSGYGSSIFTPSQPLGVDDYVWPDDMQGPQNYVCAGSGDLGSGDINDPDAQFRRTDFCALRKMNLASDATLHALVLCYQYWIALADVDGFRIDTFKHVTFDQARNFANAIKEYAEQLGKDDFFLVAEVAGGNAPQEQYLNLTGRNLNACLDIGEQRETLCRVSKGLAPAGDFFCGFAYQSTGGMPSHRTWGSQHLSISNDHDHVCGPKVRMAADASNDHQGTVAAAVQLFALGIPCLYYGTEQGLASGAEGDQRHYLSNWGGADALLREIMFASEHPRASGYDGAANGAVDANLPAFGAHGTTGWHVFNPDHPLYTRIKRMAAVRRALRALRRGRQYHRETSVLGRPFAYEGAGELVAWSRVFDEQEVLIVANPNGTQARGARIIVDARLSKKGMQVLLNTDPNPPASLATGARLQTSVSETGCLCVAIDEALVQPSEVLVLGNEDAVEAAHLSWNAAP